ncbi:MAG: NADP-dependent malic enzyme [Burkholderiales bacterium]|nr:NADP-dependent malic enzyme [Burkholderiales bacterium]
MSEKLRDAALEYHALPVAGKISVVPTKSLDNQRDLALAYSPGVAEACLAIAEDPAEASRLTSRANLIAVVTNGTAVLGLGNIGPLAGKPVMEGKGCLFKKFAGIDVFDLEIAENDPDQLVRIIAALEPTFGGINLEDIKSPECFYVEAQLRERMRIPVFHDDQHGTAIVAAAGFLNALHCVDKRIENVKLVCCGAGAAALACLDLLVRLGLPREHIWVADAAGVVWEGRTELMDPIKARYAQPTPARTLGEIMDGADLFLGLSAGGVLEPEMVERMAPHPVIFAMANPTPEIMPEEVRKVRGDAIIGTGRSDYPNQINNVLCFPFIFRGALDAGATTINEAMKLACVNALADLARAEIPSEVAAAYGATGLRFGPEYLIPRPFDPRLLGAIAPAVAQAAIDSGVATRAIPDIDAYREGLRRMVYQTGSVMRPVFAKARRNPRRVLYAEGEDERVLQAAQIVVDEGLARPLLLGRREVIGSAISRLGLRLQPGDFEVVEPLDNPDHDRDLEAYLARVLRRGVTEDEARQHLRKNTTLIAAIRLANHGADAMVCGTYGDYHKHLLQVERAIGLAPGARLFAAMNVLTLADRTLFITDTYINHDPGVDELVEITLAAARQVSRFALKPRVALLSHSNFGQSQHPSALKMREVRVRLRVLAPDLEVDGEMHADAALTRSILLKRMAQTTLHDDANLLVMPNLDAANIAFGLVKETAGHGVTVGPMLLGAARPVQILTHTTSVRRIVNMTAVAVVDAVDAASALRSCA